jgi:threonine dehydrogenase-like Zn-dependent dehydrogenase
MRVHDGDDDLNELQVAQGAKMRGATRIIGVDLDPEKFEIGNACQLICSIS